MNAKIEVFFFDHSTQKSCVEKGRVIRNLGDGFVLVKIEERKKRIVLPLSAIREVSKT